MIRYLAIRNFAVIESVAVEFEPSFNILTGETGAGKSILVEAVGLLLGGRASQDLIRTGAELATVEAIFEHDGGEVVVRREITGQGRSRAFVNGALATAQALKDLSNRLVELHGQHEHQLLLDPMHHLNLLDEWAGLMDERGQVVAAYEKVQDLRAQLDRLRMDSRERSARLELVDFQLGELTKANPQPGEDEQLAERRLVLRSAATIQRLCGESYAALYEADGAVLPGLGHVWKRVAELAAIDSRFAPYLEQRDGIKAQLDDLATTLRDYGEGLDTSPRALEQVEERLALLERCKRKYGPTLENVIEHQRKLAAERAALGGGEANASVVEEELGAARSAYLDRARRLSSARRAAAGRFESALKSELADLAMERSRFEVRLATNDTDDSWTERGIDRGEFFLSPNPGEELRPLARIVSGGELSRVMLALKTLAAADQPDKTLIFDEVDAGIGGRVATVVGEKLRRLGQSFQVLCITHLPQIAAAGTTHFAIEKHVRGSRTMTSVTRLDEESRIEEIGRMMGGADAGLRARASAKELLDARRRPSPVPEAKGETRTGRKRK